MLAHSRIPVDSLAEIEHNVNIDGELIDKRFYPLQDQQFNVLALVDEAGRVVERYEYTLYGERQVFRRSEFDLGEEVRFSFDDDYDFDNSDNQLINFSGPGDYGRTHAQGDIDGDGDVDNSDLQSYPGVSPKLYDADTRCLTPTNRSAVIEGLGVALCSVGFTGKRHDAATGYITFPARIYDPQTGRFPQRDPGGYPDGMNGYAGYYVLRGGVDPRPETENPEKYADSESSAAPCARDAPARPIAPELAGLIDAWAGLPEPVRCGILAMVEASKKQRNDIARPPDTT